MAVNTSTTPPVNGKAGFLLFLACLVGVLVILFHDSFHPDKVIFSNDGPLGFTSSAAFSFPEILTGAWYDLNWLGFNGGAASLNWSGSLMMVLGALYYAKFLAPFSMFVLGVCAWLFFRQLGFSRLACLLGGLAAALNSNIFSHVCWGLGSRAFTVGMFFLALAALATPATSRFWLKCILAGAAVGMSILEGADNGVIFSLYVAAFVVFQAWLEGGAAGTKVRRIWRLAVVALFAGIMAVHGIYNLWGFAVKNVAGMEQDSATKEKQWNFATQWSLSKAETLRVLIPGLFGYRMDTPEGGNYWGKVGQDMAVPDLFKAAQDPTPKCASRPPPSCAAGPWCVIPAPANTRRAGDSDRALGDSSILSKDQQSIFSRGKKVGLVLEQCGPGLHPGPSGATPHSINCLTRCRISRPSAIRSSSCIRSTCRF